MGARLKLTEEDAPPSASFGAKMEELRSKYLAPSAERNWYLRSAGSDRVAVSGRGRSFRNRYVGISERTAFLEKEMQTEASVFTSKPRSPRPDHRLRAGVLFGRRFETDFRTARGVLWGSFRFQKKGRPAGLFFGPLNIK